MKYIYVNLSLETGSPSTRSLSRRTVNGSFRPHLDANTSFQTTSRNLAMHFSIIPALTLAFFGGLAAADCCKTGLDYCGSGLLNKGISHMSGH